MFKRGSKYMAHIRIDKKLHHLGSYKGIEEAIDTRVKALKAHLNEEENKNSILSVTLKGLE